MSQPSQDKPSGMRNWMRVVLIVSLALNLLMIGAIGGAVLKHGKWRGHHASRLHMVGGPMTRALDNDDRRAIGRKMREAYREGGSGREERQEYMRGLIEDLKAVPFDPAAVKTRMESARSVFRERLDVGQAVLLDHLASMDDAERAAYADRLQNSFRH